MHKAVSVITVVFGMTLAATLARADVAFGAGVSTLGLGVNASVELTSMLALRANANYANFVLPAFGLSSKKIGGIKYGVGASLSTYGLIADFRPFGFSTIANGLVLSGGVYHTQNEFDFTADVSIGTTIGGYTLTTDSTIKTNLAFDKKYAPYAAIGYDGTYQGKFPISFYASAGVLFQGGPSVNITASTSVPPGDLYTESVQFENSISNFQYYPVFSAGLMVYF